MSLDTYDNLKDEIISWSKRSDLDLKIDTFIDLAESEMYANKTEPLKIRSGDVRTSFSTNTTDRFADLPADYQSMRKIRIQITNGESYEVYFRTPAQMQIISIAGMPCFFTVHDKIEFDRISDQVYTGEIHYHQDFTALSDSNTTNTVLTNHPTIYLYGALWALKNFTEQYDEATNFYGQFISAIQGANLKADMGRFGPAPVMRVEGPTP